MEKSFCLKSDVFKRFLTTWEKARIIMLYGTEIIYSLSCMSTRIICEWLFFFPYSFWGHIWTSVFSGRECCEQRWTQGVVIWGGRRVRVRNGVIPAKYFPFFLWYNFNCVRRRVWIWKKKKKQRWEEDKLKCRWTWPLGAWIVCGVFPASWVLLLWADSWPLWNRVLALPLTSTCGLISLCLSFLFQRNDDNNSTYLTRSGLRQMGQN